MRKFLKEKQYIEIWGDVVESRHLLFSMVITTITTFSLFSFAPKGDRPMGLLLGLAGAVLGFSISVLLIKPKRNLIVEDE
ncbi:MAG: hypothetical protein CVU96_01695 [Firmicutes bacterium HGW-Firmicutes-20]|jgi:hypothetical protein|nr:MAG: hypothetical protein CVU96_01695 [Firmicutes bacterium HGW-Firmicutes-20]PKM89636.1 MAG: hypothetical protein CVU85_02210 [Firmicutes bacterium HGW-Firmicutes-10]